MDISLFMSYVVAFCRNGALFTGKILASCRSPINLTGSFQWELSPALAGTRRACRTGEKSHLRVYKRYMFLQRQVVGLKTQKFLGHFCIQDNLPVNLKQEVSVVVMNGTRKTTSSLDRQQYAGRLTFTRYSLLVTSYFLLVTCYFLLVTRYFLLVTRYFLLVTSYPLPSHSLLISFLLITFCSLLLVCHLLNF